MNTEQERAEFEAFASQRGLCVTEGGDLYRSHVVAWMWKAWQARAALQSQPTEAFPCQIIEADFETGTVTLEMEGKYTVSAGQKYLCNAPLQSQDREGIIKAARAAMNESFEVGDEYGSIGIPSDRAAYLSLLLDEYDHARRIEGEGE